MGLKLASDWSALLAVLTVVVLTAVVYASYRRNYNSLPRKKGLLLLALRVAVVVFLFLCILKPVLSYQSIAGEKSRLVLLVDNSQSMSFADAPGPKARIDAAKDLVFEPDGLLGSLTESFAVQTFVFSGGAAQLPPGEAASALDATGNVTAIMGSLREAALRSGSSAPAAAVLVTDGADNSAGAGRLEMGFPIFALGVGSKLSEKGMLDVSLSAPVAPEEAYKGTTVQVKVQVKATGLKSPTSIPVTLSGPAGEMMAAGEADLSADKLAQELTLSFVADSPGIVEYTLCAAQTGNEQLKENNRQSFILHVLDSKLRVLLVDRARWEYKYLKLVLEQDPNIQFTGAVLTQKNQFTLQGAGPAQIAARGLPVQPEGYENWNVVFLGDLDREAFTPGQLEALKEFVARGGGFCALGGKSALGLGGYGGTTIEQILPVQLGGRTTPRETSRFVMQITEEGRHHPIMQGVASFFDGAPEPVCELEGINITGRPKPGAAVIAEHPALSTEGEPLAIVACQRYGEGRTMVVASETTHKWHLKHRGLGLDSPYVRFWGQAVRWLAGVRTEEAGGLFSLWTDRRNYLPGQKVHVNARLNAREAQQPLPDSLPVEAVSESHAQTVQLKTKSGGQEFGRYEGEFLPSAGGQYEITSSVTDREGETLQKSVTIAVGRRYLEFENPDLNEELLRRIAAESGGAYYAAHEASRLLRDIEAIASAHSQEHEVSVWDTPLFFLLFLILATAEWVLRKRNMLV